MTRQQDGDVDVDVLVAGAGPVGLMAAGELARRGVRVRVVERQRRRSTPSKALVLQPRTLEAFDLAGIAERFVARGYPAPGLDLGLSGSAEVSITLRSLHTRFPFQLVVPQRCTEELLEERLAAAGGRVETGSELISVEQDDAEVTAVVRSAAGAERIRARYLVGCDGTHSTVRRLVGVPFEGRRLDELVLIGDVRADADFARSRIRTFTANRGLVSIVPFLGDRVRVCVVDVERQGDGRDEPLSLDELQDAVNAIVPAPIRLSDPVWLTRYVASSRRARTTRVGRVFLAGDAAHAHRPAGGEGMNAGLQDAANLAWRLALVAREAAPERLLDGYDRERPAAHRRAVRATDRMFGTFAPRHPALRAVRTLVARTVVPRPAVQRRLAASLSGLAVRYPPCSDGVARDERTLWRSALRSGMRAPDAELWTPGDGATRVYELLRSGGYVLFVYATPDRPAVSWLRQLARFVAGRYRDITVHLVVDEGWTDPADLGGAWFHVDVRGEFAAGFGVRHGSVVLVRPDGHVGFHVWQPTDEDLAGALAPWLIRRRTVQAVR